MKSKTYVKGNEELQAILKQLRAAGNAKQLVPAVNAGLLIIQNEIVAHAPYLTGTYKRSWHLGTAEARGASAYNTTGTDVVYAARLEFGFEGVDSLGRSYHQPAQPHVRPAFDTQQDNAIKEVTEALKALIESAV